MLTVEEKVEVNEPNIVMLIYTSLATHVMGKDELLQILSKARENNERLNISGLLLYKDGNFLQVLEGPDGIVDDLFNTIKMDSRHHEVTKLLKRPIAKREFSLWEMGFTNLTEEDANQIAGFSPFLLQTIEKTAFIQPNTVAQVFLEAFRQVMR